MCWGDKELGEALSQQDLSTKHCISTLYAILYNSSLTSGMVWVQPRRASPNMSWFTAQATSSHGPLQVKQLILLALGSKLWNKAKLRNHVHVSFSVVNVGLRAWFSGVSLTDDEADNTQGSRYCLVAIGRLQVCVWNRLQNILFSTRYVSKFASDTWWMGHRGVGEPRL